VHKRPQKKSSRKVGRASRKPAHNRYNLERRWERNKERRIAKQARKEAKKAAKKAQKNE
jgi:hypothetical protein